jgi:hypothetical protein
MFQNMFTVVVAMFQNMFTVVVAAEIMSRPCARARVEQRLMLTYI